MSQRTRRYTDRQREAILRAVLVDGLSVAEAHRRAEAGELPGIPAFKLAYRSALAIVAKGRDGFGFETQDLQDFAAARAALDADALGIAGLAHQAAVALRSGRKLPEGLDLVAIKKAADAISAARRGLPPERPGKTAEPTNPTEPQREQDPTLAKLLASVGANGSGNGHATTEEAHA